MTTTGLEDLTQVSLTPDQIRLLVHLVSRRLRSSRHFDRQRTALTHQSEVERRRIARLEALKSVLEAALGVDPSESSCPRGQASHLATPPGP